MWGGGTIWFPGLHPGLTGYTLSSRRSCAAMAEAAQGIKPDLQMVNYVSGQSALYPVFIRQAAVSL